MVQTGCRTQDKFSQSPSIRDIKTIISLPKKKKIPRTATAANYHDRVYEKRVQLLSTRKVIRICTRTAINSCTYRQNFNKRLSRDSVSFRRNGRRTSERKNVAEAWVVKVSPVRGMPRRWVRFETCVAESWKFFRSRNVWSRRVALDRAR